MRCSQGGLRLGRDKRCYNSARPFLLLCEYNHKSLMVVKDFFFYFFYFFLGGLPVRWRDLL
jgi:hypothetical protein